MVDLITPFSNCKHHKASQFEERETKCWNKFMANDIYLRQKKVKEYCGCRLWIVETTYPYKRINPFPMLSQIHNNINLSQSLLLQNLSQKANLPLHSQVKVSCLTYQSQCQSLFLQVKLPLQRQSLSPGLE